MTFGILLLLAIFLAGVGIGFLICNIAYGAVDSNGNIVEEKKPVKLDCLLFTDGKLAIVKYSSRGGCGSDSGSPYTVSWFLKQGYHIDAIVPTAENGDYMMEMGTVWLSR